MARAKKSSSPILPIIKLRFVLTVVFIIALIISGPMLLVWKQVYITTASQKFEIMSDSLTVLNRQVATLRVSCERLSSTERIEKLAKENLGLDYPSSNQIVIVQGRQSGPETGKFSFNQVITSFKQAVLKDRG